MGYTHYWTFQKPAKGDARKVELAYVKAISECAKLARAWNAEHVKGSIDDADRLSGYAAHAPANWYGGIELNGKGNNAHETFTLREHYNQNLDDAFNFCKTARKPYDTVVTACLSVLKYRLGNLIEISSDGDAEDWDAGVAFARRVLKRAIPNPLNVKPKRKAG